jgi:hypothetical protein
LNSICLASNNNNTNYQRSSSRGAENKSSTDQGVYSVIKPVANLPDIKNVNPNNNPHDIIDKVEQILKKTANNDNNDGLINSNNNRKIYIIHNTNKTKLTTGNRKIIVIDEDENCQGDKPIQIKSNTIKDSSFKRQHHLSRDESNYNSIDINKREAHLVNKEVIKRYENKQQIRSIFIDNNKMKSRI